MQIRIVPDALRNAAGAQRNIINQIMDDASKLKNIVNQLNEAWEGASGAQAQNALEEIRVGIKKILDGAEKSVSKISIVADAFERIDDGEMELIAPMKKFTPGVVPMPIGPGFALSMPGMVRIDPDRVRDLAEQCKVISISISDKAAQLDDSIRDLAMNWEGKSYMKYEEETREIIRALRMIEESMNEFASKSMLAANRYEEIDSSF